MRDAERFGVWGASGSGKSAFVKSRLWDRKRIIVFDPIGEYVEPARGMPNLKPCANLNEILDGMRKNWSGFRLQYQPQIGQEIRACSALCKMLMQLRPDYKQTMKGPHITLVVDELPRSFPAQTGARQNPGFAAISSMGRHYGVEVWGVSQRVKKVHGDFRNNLTNAAFFQMPDEADAKAAAAITRTDWREILHKPKLAFVERTDWTTREGSLVFRKNSKKARISYIS